MKPGLVQNTIPRADINFVLWKRVDFEVAAGLAHRRKHPRRRSVRWESIPVCTASRKTHPLLYRTMVSRCATRQGRSSSNVRHSTDQAQLGSQKHPTWSTTIWTRHRRLRTAGWPILANGSISPPAKSGDWALLFFDLPQVVESIARVQQTSGAHDLHYMDPKPILPFRRRQPKVNQVWTVQTAFHGEFLWVSLGAKQPACTTPWSSSCLAQIV